MSQPVVMGTLERDCVSPSSDGYGTLERDCVSPSSDGYIREGLCLTQ